VSECASEHARIRTYYYRDAVIEGDLFALALLLLEIARPGIFRGDEGSVGHYYLRHCSENGTEVTSSARQYCSRIIAGSYLQEGRLGVPVTRELGIMPIEVADLWLVWCMAWSMVHDAWFIVGM
jgi:hypothetical protein